MANSDLGFPVPANAQTVFIVGRIAGKPRQYQDRDGQKWFAHSVRCPSPDQWSGPSQFEVHAKAALGSSDDDINVNCRLSGGARAFRYTEKETGESKAGMEFRTRLVVIE